MSNENKEFLRKVTILALPMLIQGLLDSSVQIMDTVMIGSLGTQTIAGVGIANQVFFIFILIVYGISSGCSIFVGQYFGSKNYENIKKIIGVGLLSSGLVGILFTILAFTLPSALLSLYSTDQIVIDIGVRYIKIVSFTYTLVAISAILHTSLKSIQLPKYSTLTTFITLATNVTLNYIFIFKLNMGVEGAAIATLISRFLEITILITIIRKKDLLISGTIEDFLRFDIKLVKLFYSKAGFVILNELIWATGVSTYTMSYGIVGTTGQAAVQISNNASNLFMVVGFAIGNSSCIILADMLGAKENEKAIAYSKKFSILSISVATFMSTLFIIASPLITKLFNAEPEVANSVYKISFVLAIVTIAKTYNFMGIVGVLRSGGDTMFTTLLDFVCVWFVGVPLAYFGAKYFGLPIHLVVLCTGMEEIVKLPIVYFRVKNNKWANTLV